MCQCAPEFGDRHSCIVNCVNTPGSYECVCNEGHMLATDRRTCIGKLNKSVNCEYVYLLKTDINECAVNNGNCTCRDGLEGLCSASCNNLNGSHACECSEGYQLDVDQRTCIGTPITIQQCNSLLLT